MKSVNLSRLISALMFLALFSGLLAPAEARDERAQENSPLVALLAPQDGSALNAATLRVQALVAAFKPHPHRSFVFNGQEVAGVNAGRVSLVEIALDDAVVERVESPDCRRQLLVDSRLDLTGLADGPHTLTVTAFQGYHRARIGRSASIAFTLDRSLPLAEVNRVEEAATPAPFACFALRDDDDDDERHGRHPGHADVHGRLVLGGQSDGIDLERDRIVIAVGSQIVVFEPGSLDCRERRNRSKCRFEDRAHPLVQRLVLEQKHGRLWKLRLRSGPLWPENATVYLRIGNDWGGIDLATGERLARMRQALDTNHQAQGTIGPAGGTVETTDAAGVVIRLDVPAGALTQDTLISVTPLRSSPVPGSDSAHPGVKLEPEWLQFAKPVTLTYDFGSQAVPSATRLFLVTSPLTKLPLGGALNGSVLTATLRHFSTPQPGSSSQPLVDRVAWANSVLGSSQPLTTAEMQSLLGVAADQMLVGCTSDCLDLAAISDKIESSVAAAAAADCADPAATASKTAIQRLLELERLVQQAGGSVPTLLPCADAMLGALITQLTGPPASTATTDPVLTEAKDLGDTASAFNLTARADEAFGKLANGIRVVVNALVSAAQAARGTPEEAQVTQQAREGIEQGQIWVTTIAPEVLRVDAGLGTFLQDALNSLSGGGLVTIKRESSYSPGTYTLIASRTETYEAGWRYVWCPSPNPDWSLPPSLATDAAPPVSMSCSTLGGQIDATFTQPSSNVLGLDVSAVAISTYTGIGDQTGKYTGIVFTYPVVELAFRSAGTLRLDVNPSWLSQGSRANLAVSQILPDGSWTPLLPYGTYSDVDLGAGVSATLDIGTPGAIELFLSVLLYGDSNQPGGANQGSGRVFTFTFTPSP